jgi:hypothetical protein
MRYALWFIPAISDSQEKLQGACLWELTGSLRLKAVNTAQGPLHSWVSKSQERSGKEMPWHEALDEAYVRLACILFLVFMTFSSRCLQLLRPRK